MLSEFKLLADALERSGFGLSETSPDISSNSCSGLIITHLADGNLRVEYFKEERKVWNYAPTNHLSFPRGKIVGPFYQTTKEDARYFKLFKNKSVEGVQKLAALRELIAKSCVTADEKYLNKFWKYWRDYPKNIADTFLPRLAPNDQLAIILTKLSSGSDFSVTESQRILIMLASELLNRCEKGQIPFDLVQPLLVADTKSKDIFFFHDCMPSVFNDGMKKQFNELVMTQNVGAVSDGICSLTGQPAVLIHDTFPQVNLPALGQKTVLLAMNKKVLCHERHGVIAADICPVGVNTAERMAAALDQITRKENKGKTWKGIPSNVKKKKDLLIVYCKESPMDQGPYADEITGDDDEENEIEERVLAEKLQAKEQFRSLSQTVVNAANGRVPDYESKLLRCFILREIDLGRRRVVYSDTFTVEELFAATQAWHDAGENIPEIVYSYSLKKKVAATEHRACSPSLSRSVELFQTVWGSDLTHQSDIAGISFHEMLGLLLGRKPLKHSPREMLSMLLRRTEQLLSAVGEAHHIHNSEIRNTEVKAKKTTLEVVAMFGILLCKIDEYETSRKKNEKSYYKKEQYMEDAYYHLGRLLMMIDSLHIEYCLKLRSGQVPSKLLGNAMVPVANTNADKALARLEERLCPYIGWAKKYINSVPEADQDKGEDKRKLVGWLLTQIQQTVALLKNAGLPNRRLDDVEKAQLLLGFLSGFEKKQKTPKSAAGTEDEETQEQEVQDSNK